MSWCARNPNGSWNCHPFWIPDAVQFPFAQPGHWPAHFPPSLSGPFGPYSPPGATPGGPQPGPIIPVTPPAEGDDPIPPVGEPPEDDPGDDPGDDPCAPVMFAYDYLDSYLFRDGRRRRGNDLDQATMPVIGGLEFFPLYDAEGREVYDTPPHVVLDEYRVPVFHEGQGPGVAALVPAQLQDYHGYGPGALTRSKWPSTVSALSLLLFNSTRTDSSPGDNARTLLAFGRLLDGTHKPGFGLYLDFDPATRVLNLQHTDAAGADEAVADGVTIDGVPIGLDITGEVGSTNEDPESIEVLDSAALAAMGDVSFMVRANVVGRCTVSGGNPTDPAVGETVGFDLLATFTRIGGALAQVGATTIIKHADASMGDATADFDTDGTLLNVDVAGIVEDTPGSDNEFSWTLNARVYAG